MSWPPTEPNEHDAGASGPVGPSGPRPPYVGNGPGGPGGPDDRRGPPPWAIALIAAAAAIFVAGAVGGTTMLARVGTGGTSTTSTRIRIPTTTTNTSTTTTRRTTDRTTDGEGTTTTTLSPEEQRAASTEAINKHKQDFIDLAKCTAIEPGNLPKGAGYGLWCQAKEADGAVLDLSWYDFNGRAAMDAFIASQSVTTAERRSVAHGPWVFKEAPETPIGDYALVELVADGTGYMYYGFDDNAVVGLVRNTKGAAAAKAQWDTADSYRGVP